MLICCELFLVIMHEEILNHKYISSTMSVWIVFFSHSNNCKDELYYSDMTNIQRQFLNHQYHNPFHYNKYTCIDISYIYIYIHTYLTTCINVPKVHIIIQTFTSELNFSIKYPTKSRYAVNQTLFSFDSHLLWQPEVAMEID